MKSGPSGPKPTDYSVKKKPPKLARLLPVRRQAMRKRKSSIVPSREKSIRWSSNGAIVLVLMLTACASPGAPSSGRALIPANLTSLCQPLPDLQDGTAGSALRWIVEASDAYHDCARKHQALVEAVK